MGLRASAEQLEQTLRTMPVRSRVWLLLAIFLTFASLTLWSDASAATSGFWTRVAAWAWLSGSIGVGYATVGFGYRMLLPVVIVLNVLGPTVLHRWSPQGCNLESLTVSRSASSETPPDTGVRPHGVICGRVEPVSGGLANGNRAQPTGNVGIRATDRAVS